VYFLGGEIRKVFRSLSKFILHPLIHTRLQFNLAQDKVVLKCFASFGSLLTQKDILSQLA